MEGKPKNPTVRGNLKLLEELQTNVAEIRKQQEVLLQNQGVVASSLADLITTLTQGRAIQAMIAHRRKWKETLNQLKEIADAANSEGERETDNQDNTG